jgi:hypothetical protein
MSLKIKIKDNKSIEGVDEKKQQQFEIISSSTKIVNEPQQQPLSLTIPKLKIKSTSITSSINTSVISPKKAIKKSNVEFIASDRMFNIEAINVSDVADCIEENPLIEHQQQQKLEARQQPQQTYFNTDDEAETGIGHLASIRDEDDNAVDNTDSLLFKNPLISGEKDSIKQVSIENDNKDESILWKPTFNNNSNNLKETSDTVAQNLTKLTIPLTQPVLSPNNKKATVALCDYSNSNSQTNENENQALESSEVIITEQGQSFQDFREKFKHIKNESDSQLTHNVDSTVSSSKHKKKKKNKEKDRDRDKKDKEKKKHRKKDKEHKSAGIDSTTDSNSLTASAEVELILSNQNSNEAKDKPSKKKDKKLKKLLKKKKKLERSGKLLANDLVTTSSLTINEVNELSEPTSRLSSDDVLNRDLNENNERPVEESQYKFTNMPIDLSSLKDKEHQITDEPVLQPSSNLVANLTLSNLKMNKTKTKERENIDVSEKEQPPLPKLKLKLPVPSINNSLTFNSTNQNVDVIFNKANSSNESKESLTNENLSMTVKKNSTLNKSKNVNTSLHSRNSSSTDLIKPNNIKNEPNNVKNSFEGNSKSNKFSRTKSSNASIRSSSNNSPIIFEEIFKPQIRDNPIKAATSASQSTTPVSTSFPLTNLIESFKNSEKKLSNSQKETNLDIRFKSKDSNIDAENAFPGVDDEIELGEIVKPKSNPDLVPDDPYASNIAQLQKVEHSIPKL